MLKRVISILYILFCLTFIMPFYACSDLLNGILDGITNNGGDDDGGDNGDEQTPIVVDGSLSFHFMMLGNEFAGDCIYIKAGDNDILIDAGSREGSAEYIKNYVDQYVADGKLEYVIVTHAHRDHIAGFAASNGIFDMYECETIIDFPKTDVTSVTYNKYIQKRDAEVGLGAKHYTALECWNNLNGAKRTYQLDQSVQMQILYNYYYENKGDENDYSVCVQFSHGERKFLFTGDLELHGEEKLVLYNDLSQVELYKAGHHGSKTSSNDCLLSVIRPKMCVVCCCAGSVEYTQSLEATFPTQAFINRIAPYTNKVYVPIMIELIYNENKQKYENAQNYQLLNGNVVVDSTENEVKVNCSNNNTLLKDTDWFKNNRTCPSCWSN